MRGSLDAFNDQVEYVISKDDIDRKSAIDYILLKLERVFGEYYRFLTNNDEQEWYVDGVRDIIIKNT